MLHQAKHLAGFFPVSSEPLVDEAGDHLWDGTVEAGKVEHEGVVRVRRGELLGAACADYPAGEWADFGAIPEDDRMINQSTFGGSHFSIHSAVGRHY